MPTKLNQYKRHKLLKLNYLFNLKCFYEGFI